MRGFKAEVPVAALEQIVADGSVRRISYDREVRALLDVAAPTVRAPQVWESDHFGEGVGVAIVDTGIHPHADFTTPRNRIVAFRDLIGGRSVPYDDNGHGTHVAGIVAGNGARSNGKYRGVAPKANLVGVKVLNALGSSSLSTVIEGIEWAVREKETYGIRILSLSLGAPAQDSYEDDPVAQAVGAAWKAGLVVCVAAGNDGPEARTISTPGIHPSVITVGASDDRGTVTRSDDTVADFSSRGPTVDDLPKPDFVAPGVEITATNAPKSITAIQQGEPKVSYIALSGTSMATPISSGAAALLLEIDPKLTPDLLKERLVASCETLGFARNTEGHGLLNVGAAAKLKARPRKEGTAGGGDGSRLSEAG